MTRTSMLPAMEAFAQAEAASRPPHAAARGGHESPVCVMHVLHALRPGGMEFGVVKLVNGLDRARVRSSICSTAPVVGNMKSFVSPEVPIFELRRRTGNDPKLVWDLYKLFRRERPHVVHTHAWGTLIEGVMAARLAGIPFVVHGEHGTLQLRGYQARLQRWVWGQTTQVLSVSQKLAEKMTAGTGFPAHRIRTIQNGVDFSRFSPLLREPARQAFGLGSGVLAIGTAGRLVPVKHQENLIDALAIVRDRGVEFTAFIAGQGPLREMLETRISERGLTGQVRLLGHRSDIERVFAALDIFVLPSRSEGMSNTILEAMASGVPVVATNVGDAPELVDHGRTGLLVPREDTVGLAAALVELAVDAVHRRQMGATARMKAETQFSLDRMLRAYEALYLDLVSVRAGHQLGC